MGVQEWSLHRIFVSSWAVLSLVLGSPSPDEKDCASLAAAGDCDFYTCLDNQLGGCGRGAYPLGLGYKYCKRFLDSRELFDQEGQEWIDKVRHCLMRRLINYVPPLSSFSSCQQIAMVAYDSHPGCYVEGGVCSSMATSCDRFMRVVELLEFSDLLTSAEVGLRIAAKQVFGIVSECPWAVLSCTVLCPLKRGMDWILISLANTMT